MMRDKRIHSDDDDDDDDGDNDVDECALCYVVATMMTCAESAKQQH